MSGCATLRKTTGRCVDCGHPRGDSPTVRCEDCRRIHNAEARERDRRQGLPVALAETLEIADRLERLARRRARHIGPELERIAGELRALAGRERAA